MSTMRATHPVHAFVQRVVRIGTRLIVLGAYVAALVVGYNLIWPYVGPEPPAQAPVLAPVSLYEAQAGQTLHLIALEHGVPVVQILALNPELNPLAPLAGVEVRVP